MHLVQQHTFNIQCSSPEFGKEIQNQLGSLLGNHFYPKLEILFDKYAIDKHTWDINTIALELPNLSRKNWKDELVHHSLLQMEEYLKTNISLLQSTDNQENNMSKNIVSDEGHIRFLFFLFLKTGILAENSISKKLTEIVSKIEITIGFLEELIKHLIEDSTCFERWLFSVPSFFKKMCIDSLVGFQETDLNGTEDLKQQFKENKTFLLQWFEAVEWTNYIQKKSNLKQQIFKNFTELSAKHWTISLDQIRAIFKTITTKNNSNFVFIEMGVFIESYIKSEKPISLKNDFNVILEKPRTISNKTQFITNAGLVILHPFLQSLFEQLNLCKNDIWTTEMNQHKSILLTQFMITGEEKSYENELFLNKILCGFPLEGVVNTQLKITKKEKEKCYSLLQAVSQHWKVMSTSSIEALQESFLQRDGKIVTHSDTIFELWVEEKGLDILLEQLPWGIGMVKTPWMEEYLTCNWS